MSSTDKIRVATLTANYNNGQYIKECLNGILGQTRKPQTIIIVDDASTDNSIEVIEDTFDDISKLKGSDLNSTYWTLADSINVVLFKKEKNSGPAATRNIGLRYLLDKSDIILIADSDDIYYPNKIERSLEPFKKYREVALVYSDYDNFNVNKGTQTREYKEPFSIKRLYQECIVSNNSAIATSVLNTVGLYDEDIRGPEDYDLWLRISDVAAIYHIPESLYKYRITGNNITVTTPSQEFARQVAKVHQKARDRHGIKN